MYQLVRFMVLMMEDTYCSLGILWDTDKEIGITQDGGFKYYPNSKSDFVEDVKFNE